MWGARPLCSGSGCLQYCRWLPRVRCCRPWPTRTLDSESESHHDFFIATESGTRRAVGSPPSPCRSFPRGVSTVYMCSAALNVTAEFESLPASASGSRVRTWLWAFSSGFPIATMRAALVAMCANAAVALQFDIYPGRTKARAVPRVACHSARARAKPHDLPRPACNSSPHCVQCFLETMSKHDVSKGAYRVQGVEAGSQSGIAVKVRLTSRPPPRQCDGTGRHYNPCGRGSQTCLRAGTNLPTPLGLWAAGRARVLEGERRHRQVCIQRERRR